MGEILIWLHDCNFYFLTISKLVLSFESCYWIYTLYLKVVCKTERKIWSHSHYVALSMFVQLHNFIFKVVLSVISHPEKDYISEQFPYIGNQCCAILFPKCIQFLSDLWTFLWTWKILWFSVALNCLLVDLYSLDNTDCVWML